MADSSAQLDRVPLTKALDDDEEVALANPGAAGKHKEEEDEAGSGGKGVKSEAQINGVMVLALLDKIIGVVDQIQQTQNGLEARQDDMERSVSGIHGELTKLTKSYGTTSGTVNKMLDKVRKVSVNIKSVRSDLEKQAGQIKRLESNEHELLKRRNFKVMIYQEEGKAAAKVDASKPAKGVDIVAEGGQGEGEAETKEGGEEARTGASSDEEVEIEEIIEESRAERIKRSGRQQIDNIKKAFSKENMEKTRQKTKKNMEKTRQKTKENLEKTRQKTKENMEKTRQNLGKTMEQLGNRITIKPEHKEKLETSPKKVKKASNPSVYKVPPFTFHVKKYPEGAEEEVVLGTEGEEQEETAKMKPVEEGLEEALVEVSEELSGPEAKTLLKVAEDSELVLVELNHKKDGK
ncbi:caveolae-associated protein 1-like [Anguilla rostrata]|uniref:caveolae-associated protein 1-like n=1 Tax=Anguilla rostrata TaxID=7938 RepID=UPI0030CC0ADA